MDSRRFAVDNARTVLGHTLRTSSPDYAKRRDALQRRRHVQQRFGV
jgi:hypothetical protein